MSHAEKCPVCGGSGKIAILIAPHGSVTNSEQTCHGCMGQGWVVVRDSGLGGV